MSSRSGSSRRKSIAPKKVYEDDDSDEANDDKTNGVNGDDSDEEMPELPEGTVVVKPEPVEDKGKSSFKGPEFGSSKRRSLLSDPNQYLSIVSCTACRKQINTNKKGSARRHPDLKVLICKRCHTYYESGPIGKDEDGLDEQCRWCSEGGRLFGCDFCHNAFCRSCVIHNLGRSEISRIDEGDKWKCYVCNPRPLADLIQNCSKVLDHIRQEEKKAKKAHEAEKLKKAQAEQAKKKEQAKETEKNPASPQTKDTKVSVSTSKPSTGNLLAAALKKTSNTGTSNQSPGRIVTYTQKNLPPPRVITVINQATPRPVGIIQNVMGMKQNILPKPAMFNSNWPTGSSAIRFQHAVPAQMTPTVLPSDLSVQSLFSMFKQNVNTNNVHVKIDKLIGIASSLERLLKSIRSNIATDYNLSPNITQQGRKTAVECLKGGLELFLQEFQILACGDNSAVFDSNVSSSVGVPVSEVKKESEIPEKRTERKESDDDVVIVQDSPVKSNKNIEPDTPCVVLDSDSDGNDDKPSNDKEPSSKSSPTKVNTSEQDDEQTEEEETVSPTKNGKKNKPDDENVEAQLELLEELADEILNKDNSGDEDTDEKKDDEEMKSSQKSEEVSVEEDDDTKGESGSRRRSLRRSKGDGKDDEKDKSQEEDEKENSKDSKKSKDDKKATNSSKDDKGKGRKSRRSTQNDNKPEESQNDDKESNSDDDEKTTKNKEDNKSKKSSKVEKKDNKSKGRKEKQASQDEDESEGSANEDKETNVEDIQDSQEEDKETKSKDSKGKGRKSKQSSQDDNELEDSQGEDKETKSKDSKGKGRKSKQSSQDDNELEDSQEEDKETKSKESKGKGRKSKQSSQDDNELEDSQEEDKEKETKSKDSKGKGRKSLQSSQDDNEPEDSQGEDKEKETKSKDSKGKGRKSKQSSQDDNELEDSQGEDKETKSKDSKGKGRKSKQSSQDDNEPEDSQGEDKETKSKDEQTKKTKDDDKGKKGSKEEKKDNRSKRNKSRNSSQDEGEETDEDMKSEKKGKEKPDNTESSQDDDATEEDSNEKKSNKRGKRKLENTASSQDENKSEDDSKGKKKKSKVDNTDDDDNESENASNKQKRNRLSKKNDKSKKSEKEKETDDEEASTPKGSKKGSKTSGKDKSKQNEKEKKKAKTDENKSDNSSSSSDSDDETDSSDLSGGDTFGKRRKLRSRKSKKEAEQKGKSPLKLKIKLGKKKKNESDSENYDSDLENDIKKLSKDVKIQLKKCDANVKKEKNGKTKASKEKIKAEKKKDQGSDDSDDDDATDEYDPGDADDEEAMDEGELDNNPDESLDVKESDDETDDDGIINDSSDSEIIINSPKKKKGNKKKAPTESDSDSDFVTPKKKKLRGKLLDAKLSDSDSDVPKSKKGKKRKAESSEQDSTEDSDSGSKKKGKKNAKGKGGKKSSKKRRRIKKVSSSSDDENKVSSDEEEEDDDDKQAGSGDDEDSPRKGRKKIRKVLSDKKLTDKTKAAVRAEEERRERIIAKQKQFNNVELEDDPTSPTKCPITKKLVLEADEDAEPVIEVNNKLVRKLKPHQVEAVQFVWNCTIESLERLKKEEGSGCILAHCMGLGKTLSMITYLHTVMNNDDKTDIRRALVVCPLNTVLNWQNEFKIWIDSFDKEFFEIFELSSVKQNINRAEALKYWHENGGVMIIGYEMFRNLTQGSHCRSKKLKQIFQTTLVDPGPDVVICDEGHVLKNDGSNLSKAMSKIRTKRRVVLTGTPLQNNLTEYHCMLSFVKPNLLGTRKEFSNRFINPITNGQCADSTAHDVKIMKRRAHILHEKLNGCVQRKDYSALTKFLPPKHEYVVSVRLSKVQIDLYTKYLDLIGSNADGELNVRKGSLFSDYQALMRIWTHPWVLKMDEIRQEQRAKWDDDDDSFIDDNFSSSDSASESDVSKSSSDASIKLSDSEDDGKRKTRGSRAETKPDKKADDDEKEVETTNAKGEIVKKWTTRSRGGDELDNVPEEPVIQPLTSEWWAEFVTPEDEEKIDTSGKLMLLFEILRLAEEIGDKVLVFSQSLLSLSLIEAFLERVDKKFQEDTAEKEDSELNEAESFGKKWTKGEDYFRMDGSTSAQRRADLASSFNDPENYRSRLFLISTKAGGLGINLVAANRVIIFDASWNPSHDVQSIFRVYRFGQIKPVYVYRFLAQGTMEEKIYERQVTKQSLSQRVVDEHQIERHFNARDLQELYRFKPERLDDPEAKNKPTPKLPSDHMFAEVLQSHKDWIVGYHEHDSLLENQVDQELSEEERKAAWKEYEDEKKGIYANVQQRFMGGMTATGNAPMMNYRPMLPPGVMPNMGNMGMAGMPLNQQNLLQLVQDMKQRFPNLPEDQLTHRVQSVIRHLITSQYMQQQELQKRQLEQRELQHQQQLQQIQANIQRQQQQLTRFQPPGAAGNRSPGPSTSGYPKS